MANYWHLPARLILGACLVGSGAVGAALTRHFDIPAGDAVTALQRFAKQSGLEVLYPYDAVVGRRVSAIRGELISLDVAQQLANATGLELIASNGKAITLRVPEPERQSVAPLAKVGPPGTSNGAVANPVIEPLEEIVITAEYREADLQKTAIAISVVAGKTLARQAKNTVEDALRLVPGVNIRLGNNAGSSRVIIRGIQEAGTGTDPSVNMMNDGVYQSNPGSSPTFDVARIEVLKGPQGTLYGRNAIGGVVNVVTNDPVMNTFGGSVAVQGGNFNARRAEGAINLPFTENLASRVSFVYNKRDGYLSNGGNDTDIAAGRIKFLFKPTDALSLSLVGEFDRSAGNGPSVVPAPYRTLHGDDPWRATEPHGAYRANKRQAYAIVNWDVGFGVITLQPTYYYLTSQTDAQLSGPTGGLAAGYNTSTQSTQELRLSQPEASNIQWQVGLYRLAFKQVSEPRPPLIDAPIRSTGDSAATSTFAPFWSNENATASPDTVFRRPFGVTGTQAPISKNTAWAVFGQATYPIVDAFRVTAGARYTRDTRRRDNRIFNGGSTETNPNGPYVLTNPGTATCTNGTVNNQPGCSIYGDFSAVTWKGGVEYDVTSDSMVYADVARGFKSGGVQILPIPSGYDLIFKPEYVVAYEAGSKNRFLSGTLQVNGDVYYYDYTDKQLIILGDPIGTNLFPAIPILNVGKATIYGTELSVDWLTTQHDRFSASVAYNHSKVDEATSGSTLLPGDALPNAPLWSEMAGYERTFDVGGGQFSIGANIRFYDAYYNDTDKTKADAYQPAYHKTDGHLTYTRWDGRWSATAFVNNIENVAVRSAAFPNSRTIMEAPRLYGVTLGVKF